MNPKSTATHHDSLAKSLAGLQSLSDTPLTFGTFLPICESLIQAPRKKN